MSSGAPSAWRGRVGKGGGLVECVPDLGEAQVAVVGQRERLTLRIDHLREEIPGLGGAVGLYEMFLRSIGINESIAACAAAAGDKDELRARRRLRRIGAHGAVPVVFIIGAVAAGDPHFGIGRVEPAAALSLDVRDE
jgi:hypothetical protein